jgi:transcriptional regulator with XRE-family HTH domain
MGGDKNGFMVIKPVSHRLDAASPAKMHEVVPSKELSPVGDRYVQTPSKAVRSIGWPSLVQKHFHHEALGQKPLGEFPLYLMAPGLLIPCGVSHLLVRATGVVRPVFEDIEERIIHAMGNAPFLEELRITFDDGNLYWFSSEDGDVWGGHETPESTLALRPQFDGDSSSRDVLLKGSLEGLRMKPLFERITEHLKKESLMQKDLLERLREATGRSLSRQTIQRDLLGKQTPNFERLAAYASETRDELNTAIAFSNATYENVPFQAWMSGSFPLFIENEDEAALMARRYAEDPEKRGIYWHLMDWIKDPSNHRPALYAAREAGIEPGKLYNLLHGDYYPSFDTLEALAKAMKRDVRILVNAVNADALNDAKKVESSFGREVSERMAKEHPGKTLWQVMRGVLGDLPVHLFPKSKDVDNILDYAAQPGSSGQMMFVLRQYLYLGKRWEDVDARYKNFFEREANRVQVTALNLPHWLAPLKEWGVPFDVLKDFIDDPRIDASGPKPALVLDDVETSKAAVRRKAGVSRWVFDSALALTPKAGAEPETILNMKRAFGASFDAAKFHSQTASEIGGFFPEVLSPDPHLRVPKELAIAAAHFHIGEFIARYRLERGWDLRRLEKRFPEITHGVWRYLETVSDSIQSVDALSAIAAMVAEDIFRRRQSGDAGPWSSLMPLLESGAHDSRDLARRLVYLSFRPQILAFYRIVGWRVQDPHAHVMSLKVSSRLHPHVREDLAGQIAEERARRGMSSVPNPTKAVLIQELNELMGTTAQPSAARKFVQVITSLSMPELLALKAAVPSVNVRSWYEHANQGALAYFLGYDANGDLDYGMPEGWDWNSVTDVDRMVSFLSGKAEEVHGSRAKAADALGITTLQYPSQLKVLLNGRRNIGLEVLSTLASGLKVDKKVCFYFSRGDEVRRVLTEPRVPRSRQALKTAQGAMSPSLATFRGRVR